MLLKLGIILTNGWNWATFIVERRAENNFQRTRKNIRIVDFEFTASFHCEGNNIYIYIYIFFLSSVRQYKIAMDDRVAEQMKYYRDKKGSYLFLNGVRSTSDFPHVRSK